MQLFISLAKILPQCVILNLHEEQHKYLKHQHWQERQETCYCLLPVLEPENIDWVAVAEVDAGIDIDVSSQCWAVKMDLSNNSIIDAILLLKLP